VSRYQKCKKPIWISLKQETVSGSGISWALCKSETLLQTDNHISTQLLCFLQAGCPSCCPTNSVKALKAKTGWIYVINTQQIKSHAQKSISGINTSSHTFSVSPWMTAPSMLQSITTSVHWHQGSYCDHYFVVCQTLQSLRLRPGLQQMPSYQVRCILSSHMLQRCYWNYQSEFASFTG